MKLSRILLVVAGLLGLLAPAAIAGDFCNAARRARRNPANEPRPVAMQGPGVASVAADGSTAPAAPLEQAGPFAAPIVASRPGPRAGSGGSPSSGTGLVAQARGGTISSPKQRADREIRGLIHRLF